MVHNIYQKNIDVNDLGKYHRRKPNGARGRKPDKPEEVIVEAPRKLIEDAAKDINDQKLI